MKLFEFYTASEDQEQIVDGPTSRKNKTTFEQLAKLVKVRNLRLADMKAQNELVRNMYGPRQEDEMGGMGGLGGMGGMGDMGGVGDMGGMGDFGDFGEDDFNDMGDDSFESFDEPLDIDDEPVGGDNI